VLTHRPNFLRPSGLKHPVASVFRNALAIRLHLIPRGSSSSGVQSPRFLPRALMRSRRPRKRRANCRWRRVRSSSASSLRWRVRLTMEKGDRELLGGFRAGVDLFAGLGKREDRIRFPPSLRPLPPGLCRRTPDIGPDRDRRGAPFFCRAPRNHAGRARGTPSSALFAFRFFGLLQSCHCATTPAARPLWRRQRRCG